MTVSLPVDSRHCSYDYTRPTHPRSVHPPTETTPRCPLRPISPGLPLTPEPPFDQYSRSSLRSPGFIIIYDGLSVLPGLVLRGDCGKIIERWNVISQNSLYTNSSTLRDSSLTPSGYTNSRWALESVLVISHEESVLREDRRFLIVRWLEEMKRTDRNPLLVPTHPSSSSHCGSWLTCGVLTSPLLA